MQCDTQSPLIYLVAVRNVMAAKHFYKFKGEMAVKLKKEVH